MATSLNITDPYLRRLAQVESGMNPLAKNPNSSAAGLFQFTSGTGRQYGLSDQDRFDPNKSLEAVRKFTEDNRKTLAAQLGRDPTPGELYLAHQQGAGGALKLLTNPQRPAVQLVGADAVTLNAGSPDMTGEQFAQKWTGKFDEGFEGEDEWVTEEAAGPPVSPSAQKFIERIKGEIAARNPQPVAEITEYPEDEWVTEEEWVESPNQAQELQAENPLLRTAGRGVRNIAGGLSGLADVGLLIPKTAAAGAEFLLEKTGNEGSALEKFAQKVRTTPSMRDSSLSLIDSATSNTLQPQGAIEKTTDFASELLVPSGVGAKTPGVLKAIDTAINPLNAIPKVATPAAKISSEDIRKQSSAAYDEAKQVGGILKADITNKFLDDVSDAVMPQTSKGKQLSGDTAVTKIIEKLNKFRNQPTTLDEAQEIDEFLSDEIDNFIELGRPNKQGKKLIEIQNKFRESIEGATENDIIGAKDGFEALKKARKLWAKSAKLRDVERIITRAEMSEQPANAIKSGFRSLYNNPSRMRGYSKEEKAAIKKAAESGIIGELLRGPASRLTGIIAGATGGVPGYLAGKGTEMATRQIGTTLQLNRANALADLIAYSGKSPTTSALSKMGQKTGSVVFTDTAPNLLKLQEELKEK